MQWKNFELTDFGAHKFQRGTPLVRTNGTQRLLHAYLFPAWSLIPPEHVYSYQPNSIILTAQYYQGLTLTNLSSMSDGVC